MATFEVKDQPDLTIPEDTIVRCELQEIKLQTVPYVDKQTGESKSFDKLVWWWKVVKGEYEGRKIKAECNPEITNHPNNRFRNWAEALLGRELAQGVRISDDDLVGLQADISVKHRSYRKDGQDRVAEEVDEVIPVGSFGADDDVPF